MNNVSVRTEFVFTKKEKKQIYVTLIVLMAFIFACNENPLLMN